MTGKIERVGFIGLGNMGGPMARNLTRAGVSVAGFDINPAALARAVKAGVNPADNASSAAIGADALITMLPDTPDALDCLIGTGNALANMKPGGLVLEMSTIAPSATDQIAAAAHDAGLTFVDAPVGRAPAQAESGELLFMVGGDGAALERARPLFDAMGTTVIHCGAVGTGIRTKLVNNYLSQSTCQLSAEAVALGLKMGLSLDKFLPVMLGSLATNQYLANYWQSKVLAGDIEPGFAIRLSCKDLGLAIEMADQAGASVATGRAARDQVREAADHLADMDVSALLVAACAKAGVEPPGT